MPMTVRALDPTDDQLAALHASVVAGWSVDQPHEPPPTLAMSLASVRAPASGDPVSLLVAGDDRLIGCALVELPAHDNPHVALAQLHVDPALRRRGVGRELWTAVLELAAAKGRRVVLTEARLGSALEAFLHGQGAVPQLTEVQRHQPIATLDLAAVAELREVAEKAASGYWLESWTGPTPVGRRSTMAAAMHTLNDAPMGDLDYEDEAWNADRVAVRDAAVVAAGLRMHAILALARDGAAAGFTDVVVMADGRSAWQWGTGVAPAHRGHRLGLLLKATMVERLRALEPELAVVATWNAHDNAHMIAINEQLGYVEVDRIREWQAEV